MCKGKWRCLLATDSSGSVLAVTPGGALLRGILELCDPIADDPLLPGDNGGVLFHVVTTMEGRKTNGWLFLEVTNVDDCSLMVKYGNGKNYLLFNINR